jgi:hypothetical protein
LHLGKLKLSEVFKNGPDRIFSGAFRDLSPLFAGRRPGPMLAAYI